MTQERRGLNTKPSYPMLIQLTDISRESIDKNDSELCDIALSEQAENQIEELNLMHGEAAKKVFDLIDTLKHDKLKDHEIKKVLFARVKFISKRRLYEILPEEYKREYTKKELPEKINISTEHKVIDVEPEPEIKPHAELIEEEEEDEDPQALENQFLKEKVTELEDALRKTEQFKPATAYEAKPEPENDLNIVRFTSGLVNTDVVMKAITSEIPRLRSRGWKTVEITFRAI